MSVVYSVVELTKLKLTSTFFENVIFVLWKYRSREKKFVFVRFEATVTVKLNDDRVITGTSDRLDQKKAAEFQAAERAYKSLVGGR